MNKELITQDSIIINASLSKVWEALTSSVYTVQYMYGCTLETTWKIGDDFLWRGQQDQVLYVKGKLIKLEAESELIYSVIDPHGNYEDRPENHLEVCYFLRKTNNGILVEVTQGDFASVAEGEKRYNDAMSGGGFSSILKKIKSILEEK